jgi:hypothetical protein
MRHGLVHGHNVDGVDIGAGMKVLIECGYTGAETHHVITYALQRWSRGEEEAAEKGAIDKSFYGIDLFCWKRVLAAALQAYKEANKCD